MSDDSNICYCAAYGGGKHTRSARCRGIPEAESSEPAAAPADRMIEINVAKICRAFRRGDIVLIETSRQLSCDEMEQLRKQTESIAHEADIKLIFLPEGCRVAAREEVESTSSLKG